MKRNILSMAALTAALTAIVPVAQAQTRAAGVPWPTMTVRVMVGFTAGSGPDMLARSLAEPLSKVLGQAVIVENKTGAGGNIAADQVAKANDDYTLGIVANGITSAKMLDPKLPFDPARDFSFISLLVTSPLVLVASAKGPEGAAFFALAAQNGDKWNYGSVGNGSIGHLGMEVLKSKVKGLAPMHVPFKGNPDVITALLGGDIQMALMPPGIAMPQVRTGRLKAIGLAGGRSVVVPEVPSLADAGVRDLNLEAWGALVGPAKLSKTAFDRLGIEVPKVMRSADMRQYLLNQGLVAVGTSPDGLKNRIREEMAIMGNIIATRGIKLQ